MEAKYKCPVCNGDGKETCTNPDHGFYNMISFNYDACNGGKGCPVCGWDEKHKVPGDRPCEACDGLGVLSEMQIDKVMDEYQIDEYKDVLLIEPKTEEYGNV